MENLLNDRQHLRSGTVKAREKGRVTGNGSRERDKYRARESGETGEASARVVKVDYILLSQPATCCTLGRTGLPGKSNHR